MARQLTQATKKIQQWFQNNPGVFVNRKELHAELPDLSATEIATGMHSLWRNGTIMRGTTGAYHLPHSFETRADFKVARNMPEVTHIARQEAPVFSGKVHPMLWAKIRRPCKENRVTILSDREAVIWNQPQQRQELSWAVRGL